MPTTSFSGTALKEFIATPLRARNHGKKRGGHILLMWSVPYWIMSPAMQTMLQFQSHPPFLMASDSWFPFVGITFETAGIAVGGGVTGQTLANPYEGWSQAFAGFGLALSNLRSYKWDTDPFPLRIFAYYCSTLTANFCTMIPWGYTPWQWAQAIGLGAPAIFTSSLTPYDKNITVTGYLAQQTLRRAFGFQYNDDPSANYLTLMENAAPDDPTNLRNYTTPKISIPWDIQRVGIEVPPTNSFTVPVAKFLMDDGVTEVYGWDGVLTNNALDDDDYHDPYFTCPAATTVPSDLRADEMAKPVMEPLALKMSLGDAESPDLEGWAVKGLVNEIFTYTYYRIVRESASSITMHCTDAIYGPGGSISPFENFYPYATPFYADGTFGGHTSSGPTPPVGFTGILTIPSSILTGPNPPTPYYGVNAGNCGVIISNFPVAGVWTYDSTKGGFVSTSSVFYNESIGSYLFNAIVPPNFDGVDPNPFEQPTLATQAYSTKAHDQIEYYINGESLGMYQQDPLVNGYLTEPGPVDSFEVLLESDRVPFFNSMSDWDLTGCHRRLIHVWALEKTPEELLDESHTVLGLTDQLSDIAAMSQTDRTNALVILAANASGGYAGDTPDPDNAGYWFTGYPIIPDIYLLSPIPLENRNCLDRSIPTFFGFFGS